MKKLVMMIVVVVIGIMFCSCGLIPDDALEKSASGNAGVKERTAGEAIEQAKYAAEKLNHKDSVESVEDEDGEYRFAGDITCYYSDGSTYDLTIEELYSLYVDDTAEAEEVVDVFSLDTIVGYDYIDTVEDDGTVILESGVKLEGDLLGDEVYDPEELSPGMFVKYMADTLMPPIDDDFGYVYNGTLIAIGQVVDCFECV